MIFLVRRAAAAVFVAGIGLAVVAFGATPAAATPQPIGSCTTTSGVILAVDFAHWGGPLLRACGSTPTTGYQLLNQGGWHTTGDSHDGPGFVCRIGYSGYHGGTSYPTPQQDACIVTPPTSAYWSYWHANPGQRTWTYSQLGAMSYHPQPGSVELWIFGGTNAPTFSPDSVRAHNTTRPPATPTRGNQPTAHPGGGGQTMAPPGNGGSGGGSGGGGGAGGGPATTPAGPGTATGTGGATAIPSGSAAGVPPIVDVGPTVPAASRSRTGSATPAIVALVIVVLLGAAGVTVALRRRPRGDA